MRDLSWEDKIIVFKILALSMPYIGCIKKQIIEEIKNIQKNFLWNQSTPYSTLCNSFATGGQRNVDINTKIANLQCSWVKQLYDDSFHE